MRKSAAFVVSGITAATILFLAPPAGADPTSTCPDGFVLVPVILDPDGAKNDRNGNGLVCRKVEDRGKVVGGPDDRFTDDILI